MFHQKSESELEDAILDICNGDGVPSNELTLSPPTVTQIFLLDKHTTQLSCPETCNWVAIEDLKTQERFETDGDPQGKYEQFNLQKYLTVLT